MGKSDSKVFNFYLQTLNKSLKERNYTRAVNSVAFLGFPEENSLTEKIQLAPSSHDNRQFYDLSLDNWDINEDWELSRTFDVIICTRTAYFAREPKKFLQKCYDSLNEGGFMLCDWGLGDHWRFEKFKVGWVKDDEHEHAYGDKNFLWSCLWNDDFADFVPFKQFQESILTFGYELLKDAVKQEVPNLINIKDVQEIGFTAINIDGLCLSYEMPQLYIAGVFFK